METQAQVRGTVLRGVFKDVKEMMPGGVSAFMAHMPVSDRQEYFAKEIRHIQWYPYRALVVLLETYYQHVARYNPQKIVEMGIRAAQRDLTTIMKIYGVLTSPFTVGERSQLIWAQKYSKGEMVLVRKWDNGFDLELRGFPDIHRLNCLLVTGYIEGFGYNWRKTYRTTHEHCVHLGHATCVFHSVW
jgi:hypothetical protein